MPECGSPAMAPEALFAPGAPRLYTIPAGRPFLADLASGLARATGLGDRPDALADALVYLPNRRSARAFAGALHQASGRDTVLLPDIRALGDLEADEPPAPADEALADLPPPVEEATRAGALARLVSAFHAAEGRALPFSSALAAARDLAALLDQAALAGDVDWSRLPGLVEASDLAHHWARSSQFLRIVAEAWPDWLAETGAIDRYDRRRAVAEAVAASWRAAPPDGPVIIAGSTGATPASRVMMQAAASLPRGLVVLPGLDTAATAADWAAVAEAPSHPQFAFVETLAALGTPPSDVAAWPGPPEPPRAAARRRLIAESLLPAGLTGDWIDRLTALAAPQRPDAFAREALDGLTLMEAADPAEEALIAALLLRETLETPDATAALVTPDPELARRVSALLARWDVSVTPSAGRALMQTPAGRLVTELALWLTDTGDPVVLAGLVKHPLLAFTDAARRFERVALRGVRRWDGIDDLAARDLPDRAARAVAERLAEAAARAGALDDPDAPRPGRQALTALVELAGDLSDGTVWAGPDGEAAARLIEEAAILSDEAPALTAHALADLLVELAGGARVAAAGPDHPRLSIWGPLEARLQSADRLVLAGLNEGVWPAPPPPDAFLPRRFRPRLGLPDPDTRIGLAAHDFAALASAPEVTLLWSARREDAPAVASRWVWRQKTLLRGALGPDAEATWSPDAARDPRAWAARLTAPAPPSPVDPMPRPRPPLEARPARLSVTRINTLQRDPYAIYCEQVLQLSELEALDEAVDVRAEGTAVHAAIEAFERDGHPADPACLAGLLEEALAEAGVPEADRLSRRAWLAETAAWYIAWREGRPAPHLEVSGALEFMVEGAPFRLTAQADRIESGADGLAILDIKTGAPPSEAQIRSQREQQMPLQALIAAAGGFEGVPAGPVQELAYIRFGPKPEYRPLRTPPAELAEEARAGLVRLIAAYRRADTPYLSAPRTQFVKYDYGFNRLARRAEWTADTSEE